MSLEAFHHSEPLTLGVELELQLVNTNDYDLAPYAEDMLRLMKKTPLPGSVVPEMTNSMIEISTGICHSASEVVGQLTPIRDALVKCASYLGFAGDIFAGRWDDSKYVAELRREFAEQSGMGADIQDEWVDHINKSANAGELKKRLAEAITAAMEVNDSKAVDKFNAAAAAKVATAKAKATA